MVIDLTEMYYFYPEALSFQLHKRVLRHQANKNFHTYFSIDNVCNNIYENGGK